jgi:hypothetical protein
MMAVQSSLYTMVSPLMRRNRTPCIMVSPGIETTSASNVMSLVRHVRHSVSTSLLSVAIPRRPSETCRSMKTESASLVVTIFLLKGYRIVRADDVLGATGWPLGPWVDDEEDEDEEDPRPARDRVTDVSGEENDDDLILGSESTVLEEKKTHT